MNGFVKRYHHLVFLFFVVLLGFWQVSFLVYSLKWDLIDVVFPFRHYFSESIQSGYFPFWNPYLQTGTPFFADLQAPTFYPELLMVSLFTGYGVYVMQFLFVIYVFIAALGMYQLSYYMNKNQLASMMAGIAYAFSGYIIGHGQHFFLLIGAAWIPFVLVNYLRLLKTQTFVQVLKTAVFVFLMVSGAYQALSFVLFYLLLLIFIGLIINELASRNWQGVIRILKVNAYLLIVVVIFLLPLIISTLEVITSVDRLKNGIGLSQTLNSGQSWKSITSFFLPFSTLKYNEFWGTDPSMRNHYIGLIPLIFFALALLKRRTKTEYLFLIFGLIIFASSFQILPVRAFLFKTIPLMNLFIYAAYVRIFGLLALILLAANYMAYLSGNLEKEKNKLLAAGVFFLLIFMFFIVYSLQKTTLAELKQLLKDKGFYEILKDMQFYQHVFIQAIFQSLIILCFLFVIVFRQKLKSPLSYLLLLIVIEMVVAAQLNMSFTVTANESKPYRMKHDLALCPPKFPLPVDDKIIFNDQQHALFPPFWRNTYDFSKQVSFTAFSSFELNSFNKLDDDYPNLRNTVLNHHLVYFSDTILPLNQFNDKNINPGKKSDVLYLGENDFSHLAQVKAQTDSSDNIRYLEFSPNKITIETRTKNDQFLTMLQTDFKGWKAFIDNENTPVYISNFNYRTIFLPAGNHTVMFEYKNNKILVFYILSNIAFFLTVLFLIGSSLRKENVPNKLIVTMLTIVFLITAFFLVKRLTYKDLNKPVHQIYKERWSDKKTLFSFNDDFENDSLAGDTTIIFSGRKSFHIIPENEFLNLVTISNKEQKLSSATMVVTAEIYPENYVKALIVSDLSGEYVTNGWHAVRTEQQIEKPRQWNEIFYLRNFYNLDENDEIKIYLWNQKHSNFRIDNVTVNFYQLIKGN